MKNNTFSLLKKITFLAFLIVASSCHSNRNRLSEDGKNWKLLIREYKSSIDKKETILDFEEDGDFTLTSEDNLSRGTYKTKGSDSIKLKMNDKEGIFRATYHFVENKLKLKGLVDQKDTLYWEFLEIKQPM